MHARVKHSEDMGKGLHSENMAEVPQLSGCWASLTQIKEGRSGRAGGRASKRNRWCLESGWRDMTCEDTTGMDMNGRNAFWEKLGGRVDEMHK